MEQGSAVNEKPNVVLLAEDDDELRELVSTELEREGFSVVSVPNGSEAVSQTRSLNPDIVLMDLMMPVMNGIQATKLIKDDPATRHIPIIVGTVIDEKEDVVKGFEAGAIAYVTKPYFMPELKARINSVLQSKKLYDKLLKSEGKYRLLVENANEAIVVIQDGMLRFFNPNAVELIGHPENALTTEPFVEFVHPDDREEVLEYHTRVMVGTRASSAHSFRVVSKTDNTTWVEAKGVCINWEDKPATLNFIADITARKRAEEEMRYLAFYDCLTGLPNRLMFNEHLNQALAYAKRNKSLLATLFLDLDHFKRINDTFGHHVGDLLLRAVGERLIRIIRKSDILARNIEDISNTNVARFGGDEFVLLLTNIEQTKDAAKVARRILYTLSDAFMVDKQELFITTSIGISLYPSDGKDAETLIKKADKAMYHAKNLGRNNFQFYADSMKGASSERITLKSDLHKALENDELLLYYQPQLEISTEKVIGTEALIRWQHPKWGVVPPAEIIPLAEESALIEPISEWVLRTACLQNIAWQAAGQEPMRIAVNLSSLLLKKGTLVELLSQILNETGMAPFQLEIELPENTLIQNDGDVIEALQHLKEMGIRVAIDDFGTGYSSLYHLKNHPLDALKIDRSFIKDIPADKDSTAIVTATIAMAHSLQLEVVAVGVETEEQLEFLRERDCNVMQGYYFSPPVPFYDIIPLLQGEELEMNL
ncbi:MAG: EAL domain-containing protein [Deltaproteobacteria bacterium]|nr:MAG: EAL domain-containing protein [Deltaproteobacteria bacterium]